MHTYLLLGTYSATAVAEMDPKRTQEVVGILEGFNGQILCIYALLGGHDLAVLANLPGNEVALEASMALSHATGIRFTTMPAISIERFDQIIRREKSRPEPEAAVGPAPEPGWEEDLPESPEAV